VTFKDLQKLVQSSAEARQISAQLLPYQKVPLWIFDREQHRQEGTKTKDNCCFWAHYRIATKRRPRHAAAAVSENAIRITAKP
jgi:hypothetical protein